MKAFYPCTQQLSKESYTNSNPKDANDDKYWMSGTQIISLATNSGSEATTSIMSLARRLQSNSIKEPYFDVDQEQLQSTVDRLNIQRRLSRQQQDDQKVNSYRQIKVSIYCYATQQVVNLSLFSITTTEY